MSKPSNERALQRAQRETRVTAAVQQRKQRARARKAAHDALARLRRDLPGFDLRISGLWPAEWERIAEEGASEVARGLGKAWRQSHG